MPWNKENKEKMKWMWKKEKRKKILMIAKEINKSNDKSNKSNVSERKQSKTWQKKNELILWRSVYKSISDTFICAKYIGKKWF